MTLKEWIDHNVGKPLNFDGKFGNHCVDLFRFYLRDVLNIPQPDGVSGAKELATNYNKNHFTWVQNAPGIVPNPGDVIIFDASPGNKFGHVSVAIEANPKLKTFKSFDQNFPSQGFIDSNGDFIGTGVAHIQTHKWTEPVLGWLRAKKTEKTYSQEQWDTLTHENQDNWEKWQEELKNNVELKSKNEEIERKIKDDNERLVSNLERTASKLNAQSTFEDINSKIEGLKKVEGTLEDAQSQIKKQQEVHEQEKADLLRQIEELRRQNESMLKRLDELEGKVTETQKKETLLEKILALLKG